MPMPADDRRFRDRHWYATIKADGDRVLDVSVEQDELLAYVHPLSIG
jgi:hypothetical protein